MPPAEYQQDETRSGADADAAARSASAAGARAGSSDQVRTDVEIDEGRDDGTGTASATSAAIADFAPTVALANLLLASSQSLAQTMLDMPSRTQSESIVRLATTARAAQQVLSGAPPHDPASLQALQALSPRGCDGTTCQDD